MKQEQHGGELQWIIRKYVDSLIQKMLSKKSLSSLKETDYAGNRREI